MPKPKTFSPLLDHLDFLSISELKKWGCFKPGMAKKAIVSWSMNGIVTSKIRINVDLEDDHGRIILNYLYQNEEVKYQVKLTSIPSNLGKGRIWYFICPLTHKRCRKLFRVHKYFLHREAYSNAMYECQTLSKKDRVMMAPFKVLKRIEDLKRNGQVRLFYDGKPTKRFKKINRLTRRANQIGI